MRPNYSNCPISKSSILIFLLLLLLLLIIFIILILILIRILTFVIQGRPRRAEEYEQDEE